MHTAPESPTLLTRGIQLLKNRTILRILQGGFIVIIFAVLVQKVLGYREELSTITAINHPEGLIRAFPLVLATLLAHGIVWTRIVNALGEPLPLLPGLYTYFFSSLSRYLPGTYWYLVSRTVLAARFGITTLTAMAASGIELIINVASSGVLVLIGFAVGAFREINQLFWIGIGLFGGLVLFILFRLIRRGEEGQNGNRIQAALTRLRQIPASSLVEWFVLFMFGTIFQGVALFQILSAWQELPAKLIPVMVASYAGGWLVGFLNPLTPNGLGAREAILVVALGPVVHPGLVLAASILIRLFVLLGESVWSGITWLVHRVAAHSEPG